MLNNKPICKLIMLLLLVLGILLGGSYGLSKYYEDNVSRTFYFGENGDGLGMAYYMDKRAQNAQSLASLAEKYEINPDNVAAVNEQAVEISQALTVRSAADIETLLARDKNLQTQVQNLYMAFEDAAVTASDKRLKDTLYSEFTSCSDLMQQDAFQMELSKYKQLKSKFPAKFMSFFTVYTAAGA